VVHWAGVWLQWHSLAVRLTRGSGESLIMLVFHDRFVNLMPVFTGAFAGRIDVHWRV
jgi:hypothetical protein